MSIDDLLHVEHDLRGQNGRIDKHVASLHGRLRKLRDKHNKLEETEKKVGSARDFEVRQRKARELDVERANAEIETKKQQIALLNQETTKLRENIHDLSEKVNSLNEEKHHLEDLYMHPSLEEALLNDAERLGPIPQRIANKTVRNIFPELEIGLVEAEQARQIMQQRPTVANIFTSFVVYLLAVLLIWLAYCGVRNVGRRLTMTKMLFSVDMAFVALWSLVAITNVLVGNDPFQTMTASHSGFSLIVQVLMMGCLFMNIVFRCLYLANSMTVSSFMELMCVIIVAQHYYQCVWIPILLDENVRTVFWSYIGYMLINGWLAVHRARSLGRPISKLRTEFEEVDGIVKSGEWLKSKMERTIRYCEDWLTTAADGSDDDEALPVSERRRYGSIFTSINRTQTPASYGARQQFGKVRQPVHV